MYLTHNFAFNLDARDGERGRASAEHLQRVERVEFYFGLVQKHRRRILDWIEPPQPPSAEHRATVGAVLEDVIRVLTGKGRLKGDAACAAPRNWASLTQPSCKGRLCPDTETEGYLAAIAEAGRAQKGYEGWLQTTTTAAVGTEINLQLGTFTLRSNQTELLAARFAESADFETAVGVQDARLQCARVLRTQQCEQVRLMFRHDLHFWEADGRRPRVAFSRPNVAVPEWITAGLKRVPKELSSIGIMFEDTSGDRVRGHLLRDESLYEICLFRTADGPHANVFRVVSYGRRFLRTLVFSSSHIFCLHDLTPSLEVSDESQYEVRCGVSNLAAKGADRFFGRGVVVLRSLSAELGEQTFVPKRFLRGLLPSVLLGPAPAPAPRAPGLR